MVIGLHHKHTPRRKTDTTCQRHVDKTLTLSHEGVGHLSEQGDGVRGDVVVGPRLFDGADGHRDRVDLLRTGNEFLIAVTLLSLRQEGYKEYEIISLWIIIIILKNVFPCLCHHVFAHVE